MKIGEEIFKPFVLFIRTKMDRFILGLLLLHSITLEVFGGVIQAPYVYGVNPNYSFAYKVNDQTSGDSKNQQEVRNSDAVRASYSLIEQDESQRILDYHADSTNGFNAIIYKANPQIQSSPLTYIPAAGPDLEKAQDQDPHYLHNSKQIFFSNIEQSAFRDNSQKVILPATLGRINRAMLEKMEMLAPGYVALAGKINAPPGYSVKNV